MLHHLDQQRWDVHHLMPPRFHHIFATLLRQRASAPLAGLGIMMDDILQLARRESEGRMVWPTRLATGLPACRLLHHRLFRTGRIRRRKYGGIAGVLAQLLLEVLDPLFRALNLGRKFSL
jgi:hypothetical protein